MTTTDIIAFYRDLELLEIPAVGYPQENRVKWIREVGPKADAFPFNPQKDVTDNIIPYYLVRLGCPQQVQLVRAVSRALGQDEEDFLEEKHGGQRGALATLTLDWAGRLIEGSFKVAPFVFAASRMSQGLEVSGVIKEIDAYEKYAEERLGQLFGLRHQDLTIWKMRHEEFEAQAAAALAANDLKAFSAFKEKREALEAQKILSAENVAPLVEMREIAFELARRIAFDGQLPILIQAAPRTWSEGNLFPYPPSEDGFSSYYFSELSRIATQISENGLVSPALDSFIGLQHDVSDRVEIMRCEEEIAHVLDASRFAPGRWPSSPEKSLSLAQQIGVSEALDPRTPITAVNGPPGTGKTTLLRDVIANKVIERACRLAALETPAEAFVVTDGIAVAAPGLVAGTEVIIASNGNRAVENVTLEIPRMTEIDSVSFPDASYLPEVAEASSLAHKRPGEAWALIALVMGKRSNIRTTLSALRRGAHSEELRMSRPGLIDVLERHGAPSQIEWRETVEAFAADLAAFEAIMEHRSQGDDLALYVDLEGLAHFKTDAKRHAAALWVDKDLEELRTRIFLSALKVHELALRSSVDGLAQFLNAFQEVMSGEAQHGPERLLEFWRTLFLIAPIISTTFASARSLPRQIGWIGCLMIDEAGQATPQSAVPVLQRASKAVIVGDPAQLQPIVTVPLSVIEALRRNREIPMELSPGQESVQSIADTTMRLGGDLPDPHQKGKMRWAGIPLRVHRRCAQPMFDIINQISYAGTMVAGADLTAAARQLKIPYTHSQWFDVRAPGGRSHVVREEIECLRSLLMEFSAAGILGPKGSHSAMVVTPFARVQWASQRIIREVFGKDFKEIEAGTIHKFQGREADIVFLVLGSAPGRFGAASRSWAAANPSLLNVAVSRAKTKLFVVGNHAEWSIQPHFHVLASAFSRYNLVRPLRPKDRQESELLPGFK